YFSLGIEPGKYKVTLSQDGKQLDSVNNFPVQTDEPTLDFDLKKSQAEAAKQQGVNPEQLKQMQEQQAKAAKEKDVVKGMNKKLGQAQARTGKTEDAIKSYDKAAQLNPTGAAQYYYNEGAVLTNSGKNDEAIAAFDKSIAADPNKADAYYQKGVNLIAKATTDKTGKVVPAPGTE